MNLKLLVAITGFLALIVAGIYVMQRSNEKTTDVLPAVEETAAALPNVIEVADTQAKRTQGLSGRDIVADDYGMLFVFSKDDRYGLWMKDTLVPLDMFWLDDKGRVVHLVTDVQPSSYPNVFYPPVPVRYVLETAAGFAHRHSITIGATLKLQKFPTVLE